MQSGENVVESLTSNTKRKMNGKCQLMWAVFCNAFTKSLIHFNTFCIHYSRSCIGLYSLDGEKADQAKGEDDISSALRYSEVP